MTLGFLILQFLIFALWTIVSCSILWTLLRGKSDIEAVNDIDEALDPVTRFLNDPRTRLRRWAWVALTLGLIVCSSLSSGLLVRI